MKSFNLEGERKSIPKKEASRRAAHELHFGVAEQGKVLALQSKHQDALTHYREAIRMAVSIKAPEPFFRHYTQCVMESLELTGSYAEVIEYCVNVDKFFQNMPALLPIHKRDKASNLERKGVNEFKSGLREQSMESLNSALALVGEDVLPLSREMLTWLKRGLHADIRRVVELQKSHNYFVVRKELVDSSKARPMAQNPAQPALQI